MRGKPDDKIDTELLRQFMLGGTVMKDSARTKKSPGVVDLHLAEPGKKQGDSALYDSITVQLQFLEKQLDKALAGGLSKIEVVHGKGSGKLRDAVQALLKKHPRVKSFRLMNDRKRDGGATEVFFS